jgi:hypothetical protein
MGKTTARLPMSAGICELFRTHGYVVCERMLPRSVSTNWRSIAKELSREHARAIQRESVKDGQLRYCVVTGDVIEKQWYELFEFYQHPRLREWIGLVTGRETIGLSSHLQSAININVLAREGDIYRWHFDAVPYTLLLYLSDSAAEDGGALEFYPNATGKKINELLPDSKVQYIPRSGDAVLMDGTRCLHRVAPVHRSHIRISVPMVFPAGAKHLRPCGLDDYLYGENKGRAA